MRLLAVNKRELASRKLTGSNTLMTYVLKAAENARGTTFYYDEFGVSWDGRHRTGLQVSFKELPRCYYQH